MIKKHYVTRKEATLNDYLIGVFGRPVTNNINNPNEFADRIIVGVSTESILSKYFGEGLTRTMCTGLNERMRHILDKRDNVKIKYYQYRPDKGGIYVVTCNTGWAWDARAFTPPVNDYNTKIDSLTL